MREFPGQARLPSELHYFSGNCTSKSTQNTIKRNFIEKLYNGTTLWREQCVNFADCQVENVQITCGAVTEKINYKRSIPTHTAIANFDITVPIDPKGKDIDDLNYQISKDLYGAAQQLEKDVKDGKLDLPDIEADKDSFTYEEVSPHCRDGTKPRIGTYTCGTLK